MLLCYGIPYFGQIHPYHKFIPIRYNPLHCIGYSVTPHRIDVWHEKKTYIRNILHHQQTEPRSERPRTEPRSKRLETEPRSERPEIEPRRERRCSPFFNPQWHDITEKPEAYKPTQQRNRRHTNQRSNDRSTGPSSHSIVQRNKPRRLTISGGHEYPTGSNEINGPNTKTPIRNSATGIADQ